MGKMINTDTLTENELNILENALNAMGTRVHDRLERASKKEMLQKELDDINALYIPIDKALELRRCERLEKNPLDWVTQ